MWIHVDARSTIWMYENIISLSINIYISCVQQHIFGHTHSTHAITTHTPHNQQHIFDRCYQSTHGAHNYQSYIICTIDKDDWSLIRVRVRVPVPLSLPPTSSLSLCDVYLYDGFVSACIKKCKCKCVWLGNLRIPYVMWIRWNRWIGPRRL